MTKKAFVCMARCFCAVALLCALLLCTACSGGGGGGGIMGATGLSLSGTTWTFVDGTARYQFAFADKTVTYKSSIDNATTWSDIFTVNYTYSSGDKNITLRLSERGAAYKDEIVLIKNKAFVWMGVSYAKD